MKKKQIYLILILLVLGYVASAQPISNRIHNQTGCSIRVTKECYDLCVKVSSSSVVVSPGGNLNIASLGTCSSPSNGVIYTVCWGLDDSCRKDPIVPCVRVDGNPVAPSPCSPGTTTGTIQAGCTNCRNPNGVATVDFQASGTTNSLWIH